MTVQLPGVGEGWRPDRWARRQAVLACFAALTLACTPFASPDEIAQEVEEEVEPLVPGGPWGCLEGASALGVDNNSPVEGVERVTLQISYYDPATQQLVSSLELRICNGVDVNCEEPIADWAPVGGDGRFIGIVPVGFQGYLEARGEGFTPLITMVDTQVVRNLELYVHAAVRPQTIDTVLSSLQATWDREATGIVSFSTLDCVGDQAIDVRAEIDAPWDVSFVLAQGVPVAGSVTNRDGSMGFVGVPAGLTTVRAFDPGNRRFDTQGLVVRPGTWTGFYLRPRIYSAEEMCSDLPPNLRPGFPGTEGRFSPCASTTD